MKFLTIIRLVGEAASVLHHTKIRMLKKGSCTHAMVLGQRLSRGSLWVFLGCTRTPRNDLLIQKRPTDPEKTNTQNGTVTQSLICRNVIFLRMCGM